MNTLCSNITAFPSATALFNVVKPTNYSRISSTSTSHYRPVVLPSINTMLKAIENEGTMKMESPLNSLRATGDQRLRSSWSPTNRNATHFNVNLLANTNLKKILQKDIFHKVHLEKNVYATPILWELKKSNMESGSDKKNLETSTQKCGRIKCSRMAKKDSIYCKWHVDSRICRVAYCEKSSKTGGYCIAHGGGKRCQYPGGCYKSAKQGDLCIAHGGGIRCTIINCTKAAVKRGLCVAHGGGRKCKIPGCHKNSVRADLCAGHGGRRRPPSNSNYRHRHFLMQQLVNM